MFYKVTRRNRPDCIVMLCKDRTTDKWCYVNLSTEHVCSCRFDTLPQALSDMERREDVISYSWIPNPFVSSDGTNATDQNSPIIDTDSNNEDNQSYSLVLEHLERLSKENEEIEKIRKK